MTRPNSERMQLIRKWAARYGVSEEKLRKRWNIEQLTRMADHARDTIFSSMKWDREHPGFRSKGSVAARVPGLYRQRLAERAEFAQVKAKLRRRKAGRELLERATGPWAVIASRPRKQRSQPADPRVERMMQLAEKLAKTA